MLNKKDEGKIYYFVKNSERIPESVENNYLLIGKKQNIYEIIKPINSIWLHYDFL